MLWPFEVILKLIVNILKGGKSPVQDSIVAGLVLAAILWFVNQYVTEIWGPFTYAIKFVWTTLQKELETPIFLLALSGIGNFAALAMLSRYLYRKKVRPIHELYTKDIIHNLVWRWRMGKDGYIYEISAFCAEDDGILLTEDHQYLEKFGFFCEKCGKRTGSIPGTSKEFIERVKREILRRVRTGEWKNNSVRLEELKSLSEFKEDKSKNKLKRA